MTLGRIFVVGDIHGCATELDTLLRALDAGEGDTLCFLGDYVDRGPDSRGVLDRLIDLEKGPAHCIFLKGNHEDMFLDCLGRGGHYGGSFIENGGAVTLRSYGLAPRRRDDLPELLPAAHLDFLDRLRVHHDFGPSFCVHAGVRPTVSLAEQTAEDLLWIREDFFLAPHPFAKTVLYGHTPRKSIECALPYRIGLDTGLVYGGCLSCLELRGATLYQIVRRAKSVTTTELRPQLGAFRLA